MFIQNQVYLSEGGGDDRSVKADFLDFILCMYCMFVWMYVLNCMACLNYMYVWHDCITCMYGMFVLHVCMACLYYMCVWDIYFYTLKSDSHSIWY